MDYIQLVGTDAPNSCGSCCYVGPIEHDAFAPPPSASIDLLQQHEAAGSATSGKTSSGGEGLLFFNCPEGAQRFSSEAQLKLTKIKGFLFTRFEPTAVMGLPGLLFTINDAGVGHVNVMGPPANKKMTTLTSAQICRDVVVRGADGEDQVGAVVAGTFRPSEMTMFMAAIRKHFFVYRKMRFQEIVPPASWQKASPAILSSDTPTYASGSHDVEERVFRGHYGGQFSLDCSCGSGSSPSSSPTAQLLEQRLPGNTLACLTPMRAEANPFFLASIRLSAHSILLAFSTDPESVDAAHLPQYDDAKKRKRAPCPSSSDEQEDNLQCTTPILSYVLVHAPQATFDAKMARALGVLPGPKYGLLKKGIAVERDVFPTQSGTSNPDPHSVAGDESSAPLVHPHQVVQHTQMSRTLFITLILDSDDSFSLRYALQHVLGTRGNESSSELLQFLRTAEPTWAWNLSPSPSSIGTAADNSTGSSSERQPLLKSVFHLQKDSYFSSMFSTHSDILTLDSYNASLFSSVAEPFASHCSCQRTNHVFSSEARHRFSAYPTAQVHRYHLNYLAPQFFPVQPVAQCPPQGVKRNDDVWPYSLKHRLVELPGDLMEGKKGGKQAAHPSSAGHIRYPTRQSAAELLSTTFRETAATYASSNAFLSRCEETQRDLLAEDGILFLGTGSAVPSKYRNVSGAALSLSTAPRAEDIDQHGSRKNSRRFVLLDFGEGSLGQLALLVNGESESESCVTKKVVTDRLHAFVRGLSFVFMSHHHADHHLGLMSLLELRHRLFNGSLGPLLVICPGVVEMFLREGFSQSESCRAWFEDEVMFDTFSTPESFFASLATQAYSDENVERVSRHSCCGAVRSPDAVLGSCADSAGSTQQHQDSTMLFQPTLARLHAHVSSEGWRACVCPVVHPADAHALVLHIPSAKEETAASKTLLYSGDTRPSAYLVSSVNSFIAKCESSFSATATAAKNHQLIAIHEATFGEGFENEAIAKQHSTLSEAQRVARAMSADFLVLTHFSQRYPKLPGLAAAPGASESAPSPRDTVPVTPPFSFAFDLMFQPFQLLSVLPHYTPVFSSLLDEYNSWGVGTTRRLRGTTDEDQS